MNSSKFIYHVDGDNRLTSMSDSWCEFAQANGASEIADRSAVAGRSIWTFIAGEASRHLYGLIFSKVRSGQRQVVVPFRCDSPTVRRFMSLKIEPLAAEGLRLTSELLKVEEREYMPLLDAAVSRSSEVLMICAWCKRIEAGPAVWLEVEDAVEKLGLFGSVELPQLKHGACRDCSEPYM